MCETPGVGIATVGNMTGVGSNVGANAEVAVGAKTNVDGGVAELTGVVMSRVLGDVYVDEIEV